MEISESIGVLEILGFVALALVVGWFVWLTFSLLIDVNDTSFLGYVHRRDEHIGEVVKYTVCKDISEIKNPNLGDLVIVTSCGNMQIYDGSKWVPIAQLDPTEPIN